MRDLFDQDRAMTLSAVRQAIGLLGGLFLITAILLVLSGLGKIFTGHVFSGLSYIALSLSGLGFFYFVIRLIGECLAALHRLNDRLTILGDDLRHPRPAAPDKKVAEEA